jgi:hypothetical protein
MSSFFLWDLPVVKISPDMVMGPEQGKSTLVGFLPLASGPACLGMASPPFLVKQLHRCDSVVISSFVRTGYTMRRWGWVLGRIGYSITHHYPLNWTQNVNRMPRIRLPRVMKHYSRLAERIVADLWRDFWIRETRMGQQVAQLHDRHMMMMIMFCVYDVKKWTNSFKPSVLSRKPFCRNTCNTA